MASLPSVERNRRGHIVKIRNCFTAELANKTRKAISWTPADRVAFLAHLARHRAHPDTLDNDEHLRRLVGDALGINLAQIPSRIARAWLRKKVLAALRYRLAKVRDELGLLEICDSQGHRSYVWPDQAVQLLCRGDADAGPASPRVDTVELSEDGDDDARDPDAHSEVMDDDGDNERTTEYHGLHTGKPGRAKVQWVPSPHEEEQDPFMDTDEDTARQEEEEDTDTDEDTTRGWHGSHDESEDNEPVPAPKTPRRRIWAPSVHTPGALGRTPGTRTLGRVPGTPTAANRPWQPQAMTMPRPTPPSPPPSPSPSPPRAAVPVPVTLEPLQQLIGLPPTPSHGIHPAHLGRRKQRTMLPPTSPSLVFPGMFPITPQHTPAHGPAIYSGRENSSEGDDSDSDSDSESDEGRATDGAPLAITDLLDPLRHLEGELDRLALAGTRVHLSLWAGLRRGGRHRDRDMAMLAAIRARRARLEALKVRLLDRLRARGQAWAVGVAVGGGYQGSWF